MGMKRLLAAGILWAFCVLLATAQSPELKPSERVNELMEEAIGLMNQGEYEEANLAFREILKQRSVLPTELSYLFAETLYMIHQYHNSKNFLDKYLRLAGSTGRYSTQAMDLSKYLDDAFEKILTCTYCDSKGYRLEGCQTCHQTGQLTDDCYYCKAVGITMCQVCKGNGVTTSLNAFNEIQYHTCPNCQGKGQIVCNVCGGEKVLTQDCPDCLGTHKKSGTEICDHEPSETIDMKELEPLNVDQLKEKAQGTQQ